MLTLGKLVGYSFFALGAFLVFTGILILVGDFSDAMTSYFTAGGVSILVSMKLLELNP
jgi:hypothetical protein